MPTDLDAKIRAIRELRDLGAIAVRVGDIAATFAHSAGALLPMMPDAPETDDERTAREERELYGSADR